MWWLIWLVLMLTLAAGPWLIWNRHLVRARDAANPLMAHSAIDLPGDASRGPVAPAVIGRAQE